MKSPLMQIDELGDMIRQLHKIDSKLQAGQIIAAYRENRRIIDRLSKKKEALIAVQEEGDLSEGQNAE